MAKFGKFDSLEAFLTSYEKARQKEEKKADAGLSLAARRKKRRKARDVVEVGATIRVVEADDEQPPKHHHLRIAITEIVESDPDVDQDLVSNMNDGTQVFVSIRYGDRMGISDPVPGLAVEQPVYLRGEWIPKERAYSHGGEKVSVLHFTHHPIGFVCVADQCFS